MPRQFDRFVIISTDLKTAMDNAQKAGFTVVPGGTHGDGRTHNALIAFADGAYIELVSPTSATLEGEHRWFPRLFAAGGLVDFCLLGDQLEDEIAAIRNQGVEYPQPFSMGRNRPNGKRIDWLLSVPPGPVGQTGWPFLIEDVTPREPRMPHAPDEVRHPNGVLGAAGVTVLVHDLDASVHDYTAILGTAGHELTAPFSDDRLGVVFPVGKEGDQWIMLVEPKAHEAAEHLNRHGQGPYRLTLRTHNGAIGPGEGDFVDPALFNGARILLA
jgi:catechol 2,3-dioxygenase-like lactoylglutathione lyase family enzyme